MRKLLVLAFLLYDIIAVATRPNNYDYDDIDSSKRHYMQQMEARRNWRKKEMAKVEDHRDRDRDWERRRYDYDTMSQRYGEEPEPKNYNAIERQRDVDSLPGYRDRHRKYDEGIEKAPIPPSIKSSEVHASSLVDKDADKKMPLELNCQRPHERYESCFAGCASVTCDNPRDRMQPCYPFCEAGCVCVHPYVRDDRTHKCILPEDCTKGLKGIPDLGEETAT